MSAACLSLRCSGMMTSLLMILYVVNTTSASANLDQYQHQLHSFTAASASYQLYKWIKTLVILHVTLNVKVNQMDGNIWTVIEIALDRLLCTSNIILFNNGLQTYVFKKQEKRAFSKYMWKLANSWQIMPELQRMIKNKNVKNTIEITAWFQWLQHWNDIYAAVDTNVYFTAAIIMPINPLTSRQSDTQPWTSECPDVKNYKWRLNHVWHRMLYSCTPYDNSGCQRVNLFSIRTTTRVWNFSQETAIADQTLRQSSPGSVRDTERHPVCRDGLGVQSHYSTDELTTPDRPRE